MVSCQLNIFKYPLKRATVLMIQIYYFKIISQEKNAVQR